MYNPLAHAGIPLLLWTSALSASAQQHVAAQQPPVAQRAPSIHTAPPVGPRETNATLRVGTWNLEHLGQRKNPARSDEAWLALGHYIRNLDVAVLAVQEVRDPASARRLCDAIGSSWEFVLGSTGGFSESVDAIRLGFLFNTRAVKLIDAGELLDLPRVQDGLPIFHRVPITACFKALAPGDDDAPRGGTIDFRLVTCHLKASRGEQNERKRSLEMAHLVQWLGERRRREGEDQDILLLGDFNHAEGSPAWQVFQESDLGRYLGTAPRAQSIAWFEAQIDHIVAMGGIEEELVPQSLQVLNRDMLADKDAWRATYSDHVPVVIQLARSPDRDPGAVFQPSPAAHRLPVGTLPPRAITQSSKPLVPSATSKIRPLGATTAPAVAQELQARPIRAGDMVLVETTGGTSFSGRLLLPLGNWVHLQLEDGGVRGIPVDRVEHVTLR